MSLYHTHGPIDPNHPTFIPRQDTIRKIEELLADPRMRISAYPAILGARQTGKTTLLHEIKVTYAKTWTCILVSCQNYGDLNLPAFYQQVIKHTNQQLGVGLSGDISTLGTGAAFEEVLKKVVDHCQFYRLVFLIDEISGLQREVTIAFAETIRKIFDERLRVDEYSKIAFILAGCYDLATLCSRTSPLVNVVERVWLSDFSLDQIRQLAQVGHLDIHAEQIYSWTSGHPYLAQKLCSILEGDPDQTVDQAVRELIQSRNSHFEWIRQKLKESDKTTQEMVSRIMKGERIKYVEGDDSVYALMLLGVIKRDTQGNCSIRNKVYEKIFRETSQPLLPPKPIVKPSFAAELRIDPETGDVWVKDRWIPIEKFPPREYALLQHLYKHCGKTRTLLQIWEAVWGGGGPDPNTIQGVVSNLREIIEPDPKKPRYIVTVRAVRGYKLVGCA